MKKKEHLPVFGIGPFLVAGMALVDAAAIIVFYYGFKLGILSGLPAILLIAIGIILIITGLLVWFIGAMRSEMDDHIKENRLKTDGIYAYCAWLSVRCLRVVGMHNNRVIPDHSLSVSI